MHKHLISLLLIAIFIGSCTPAPASPTTPTPASTSQNIPPSETPSPTQTEVPTATPYPPLQTDGPYLLFTYDRKNFTIMDADGGGRKQFLLPNDGHIWDIDKSVSPDGRWIAYFTGSTEEPYDLALNLYDLSNDSYQLISNLIALGYPDNLQPVTETIRFNEYDTECSNNPQCKLRIIQTAFQDGLRYATNWSPDSRLLAFAAQIDGPSSDVYIFNIENQTIKRLTNEIENIFSIVWSPTGEKILYLDSVPGTIYTALNIRIADSETQNVQTPKQIDGGAFWGSNGWIDNKSFLIWDGGEGAPPHNFRSINIESQQKRIFWKYESDGYTFFHDLGGIVVIIYPNQEDAVKDKIEAGTYFVSISGKSIQLSNDIFLPIGKQSLEDSFFYAENKVLHTMNLDGIISQPITNLIGPTEISISPNKEWFVVNKNNAQIELYTKDLQLIQFWNIQAYDTIWRPDSNGLFLVSYPNVYYLQINDPLMNLVNICSSDECYPRDYVWIP